MFRGSELTQIKKLGLAIRLRQGLQLHLTPNHHRQGGSGNTEHLRLSSKTLKNYSINIEGDDARIQTPAGTVLN